MDKSLVLVSYEETRILGILPVLVNIANYLSMQICYYVHQA